MAEGGPEEVAARYLVNLTEDAIKALARKISEHRAVGVTDEEGFIERRAARRTAEFANYKRWISDRHLRLVIVNGLVLRTLEENPKNKERIDMTLQWLYDHHEATAVRQAEFVQRGLLLKAISNLEASGAPEVRVRQQIEALLWGIERFTRFVREDDREELLGDEIRIRTLQVTPNTFVVFGKGRAKSIAKEGVRLAMKSLPSGYVYHPEESKFDYVAMIGEAPDRRLRIRWEFP